MSKEQIISNLAKTLERDLKKALDKKNANATGKTRKSIRTKVETSNGRTSFRLFLIDSFTFTDKGRRAGKMPPISAIKEWVEAKKIAGRANSKGVAFAISKTIAQKGTKKPPSNFFTDTMEKFFEDRVPKATEQIAKEFKRETQQTIREIWKR